MKNRPDMPAKTSEDRPPKPMIQGENSSVTPTHLREENPAEAGPLRENRTPQQACQTGKSLTLDKNIPDTLANASEEKPAKPMISRENRLVTPTHLREEKPAEPGPSRENTKPQQACPTGNSTTLDKNIPDTLANASNDKPTKPTIPRESRPLTPVHRWEKRPTQAGPPREDRKTKRAPHCPNWEPMILDNRTSINPAPLSFQPAYLSGRAPAPSSPLHNDFTADPYFGNLNGRSQRNRLRDLRFIRDNYTEVSFQFM